MARPYAATFSHQHLTSEHDDVPADVVVVTYQVRPRVGSVASVEWTAYHMREQEG